MIQSMIDDVMRTVVPKVVSSSLLYLAYHPFFVGDLGQCRMYGSTRLQYYWNYMASDIYATVEDCQKSSNQEATMKHQRLLALLTPTGPLEFIAVDVLATIPRTRSGNK